MAKYSRPEKLSKSHSLEAFRCGKAPLDDWLHKFALVNQSSGMATVFVSTFEDEVVGYYALASGGVTPDEAPSRVTKGVPRHAVPVVILARLAIHEDHQGRGLGRALLRDVLGRVDAAANEIGVRALVVHAKDEEAREYYAKISEFEPSPTDPLHLFLLMKDLRRAMEASEKAPYGAEA